MGYELIVSEKPSAAKRIAAALADDKPKAKKNGKVPYYEFTRKGKEMVVGCAAGHLYVVAEKEKSFEYPKFDLEWKPSSEVSKSSAFSKAYLTTLKKLVKGADTFTVATDYDIEGEVIGLNIIREIAKQDDARRMKFSTLTKGDLVDAYESAKDTLDWGQANAGEARHFLDWMYGINLSRALMDAIKKAGSFKILSIGRVQGPALKIIVDREHEIQDFEPQTYWQIKADLEKQGKQFEAWHKGDKFWEKDKADWLFGKAQGAQTAVVAEIERNEYKHPAPNPFDLSSLQSESYRHFGLNPKQTLQAAQNLYTAGYISYPRTGSQKLTTKIGFNKILEKLSKNDNYAEAAGSLLQKGNLSPNNGKKSDPAHPAIFPTGLTPKSLKGPQTKVYDLIVKRFLATFGEWATRESIKIELQLESEIFLADGKRTIDKGWHTLYEPYLKLKESELPNMEKREKFKVLQVEQLEKETEPPKRYTQASLVKELERRELGTKATRADVVQSLLDRNYVRGKSLQATRMGIQTVDTLQKYSEEILDEQLTRHFEEEMQKIREGKLKKEAILKESREVLTKMLKHFDEHKEKIGEELKVAYRKTQQKENYLGQCPECKVGKLMIRKAKKSGKMFAACDQYPECKTTFPLPQSALVQAAEKQCEECSHPMLKLIRKGKRPQEVCINPECPSKQVDESKVDEKKCPKCEDGKLILRKSVYGSFLGCTNYPKCRNTEKIE